MKTLVINPGSTSTKIAMYEDKSQLWQSNIEHDAFIIKGFPNIYSQLDFRYETIKDAVIEHGNSFSDFDCVMSRGGLLPPLESGAYEVNEVMLEVLEHRPMNHHASNLGAAIAYRIAGENGIKAYIYDPVTVDEMIDVVRITGLKEIKRHGQGHNLNMRAAAIKFCAENGYDYKNSNLIVAHLGGGITLTLQSNGRIVDMISDDEGPFSPERAGLIPDYKLAKYISVNGLDYGQTMKTLQRKGGLISHLGVSDLRKVEELIASGDSYAKLVFDAMALHVAESIGRLATVVSGWIGAIILTGGMAYSKAFCEEISNRVSFIAPVSIVPGENEMQALADGAFRVMSGIEEAKVYEEPAERPF